MPDEYVVGLETIPEWLREFVRSTTWSGLGNVTIALQSPYDRMSVTGWSAQTGDTVTRTENGLRITQPSGEFTEIHFNPHGHDRYERYRHG